MLWTSVYNIVIPGQDNGDFVAPAASKTLAFYYFANGDYSLDKERWSLEMKFKQNLNKLIPYKFVVPNLSFWGQALNFYSCQIKIFLNLKCKFSSGGKILQKI